jgi:magnesium-transporting ATPase (P-type)
VLHEAGVNVWMITGDKAETGLAIGAPHHCAIALIPRLHLSPSPLLFSAGKKCKMVNLHRQELERIVNLSDEALRLRVTNLHSYVFRRKQREDVKRREEERANGECPCCPCLFTR